VLQLRRTHFHDFMLDVHSRLQKHRTDSDALHMVCWHCSSCGPSPIEYRLDWNELHHSALSWHCSDSCCILLVEPVTIHQCAVQVAEELAREMQVLALDEFFVTDVADAVILNRLFRCGRHIFE
jgi:predicted ATPase